MRKNYAHLTLSSTQQKYRAWYTVYGLVLFCLLVGNIFVSARHIYLGRQVAQLEKERAQLTRQYTELSNSIATYSSLSELKTQAVADGFAPITHTVVMNIPDANVVALGE